MKNILGLTTLDTVGEKVTVDGEDVSAEISERRTSEVALFIAEIGSVRRLMGDQKRKIAAGRNIVTEGHDQGSYVIPKADLKIYLDTSVEERANRHHKQLMAEGIAESLGKIRNEISARDTRDKKTPGAPPRHSRRCAHHRLLELDGRRSHRQNRFSIEIAENHNCHKSHFLET